MRLLTRSDFDGLACGALLREMGLVDSFKFVHPKDIQDGLVEVTGDDVLANIPYAKGCKMWFDHHASEPERLGEKPDVEGAVYHAPSAARIIFDYYGGAAKMPRLEEMVRNVDKVDSGDLKAEEILEPEGWILLGFVMDPRTGLGRFRNFRISNYALMETLMEACRTMSIEEILAMPDVVERVTLYFEQNEKFKNMILAHSRTDGNVIITDLRDVDPIYTGNRFLVYSLFPEQNISIWAVDGRGKRNCALAVGHSVLVKTSNTNVGSLMLRHGGGGHHQVGTCQVPYDAADRVIADLVAQMKADG